MHPAVLVAKKLKARAASIAEVELAASDGKAYVAAHAERLAERRVTKPSKQLPWIALVDALVAEGLAVELDHRTFPEDVVDALDGLRSLPRKRGRWTWARAVDEGMSTRDFLGAVAHHVGAPLALIDLANDSFVVVVAEDVAALGLEPIAPVALEPAPKAKPASKGAAAAEQKRVAAEDAQPYAEVRYVIAGDKRGDAVYGVAYDEPYLTHHGFFREWHGRVGYKTRTMETRAGYANLAAATKAAERELATRIAQGWRRVSRIWLVNR